MKIGSIVHDSDDSEKLSEFYKNMLGWEKIKPEEGWIIVYNKNEAGTALTFQQIDNYERPVWPDEMNKQHQMLHLDFYVEPENYEQEILRALKCGAEKCKQQFSDNWTVMLDPAGHPFCIIPFIVPNS